LEWDNKHHPHPHGPTYGEDKIRDAAVDTRGVADELSTRGIDLPAIMTERKNYEIGPDGLAHRKRGA